MNVQKSNSTNFHLFGNIFPEVSTILVNNNKVADE